MWLKLPTCTLTTVTRIATWQSGLHDHKVKVVKTWLSKCCYYTYSDNIIVAKFGHELEGVIYRQTMLLKCSLAVYTFTIK